MNDDLTALDATFLELEELDEGALMSIGGVMVFDPRPGGGVPDINSVRANLATRFAQLPRYEQRLSSPHTGGLSWPHWVDDERFDIGYHVRHGALPAPGGRAELADWTGDFFSHPLDRTRPLWEIVLLEGLEGGRWALVHKTHHCLVDGVGSVDVLGLLLDRQPSPDVRGPLVPSEPDYPPLWRTLLPNPPDPIGQLARTGVHAASAGLHAAVHPRETLARSRDLAALVVREAVPGAPRTSLNVPIGPTRRFATVSVPLAECKAIRDGLGGSVNDVVLAACTTALRSLLQGRGEELPARGLRAMVPLNLRQAPEHMALGNRVSSLFVDLPVAEPAAAVRYRRIVDSTSRLKASGAAAAATAAIDLVGYAPPLLHAAIARNLYATRLFNVTITNVPGPRGPLYAYGAALREVHPVVPLAAEHAVGIAVFSYDGLVTFGINADCESTPEISELADQIRAGIDELRTLVPAPQATPSSTK